MFTRAFWADLGERVVSSFAGGVLAALGGDAVNAWEVDWKTALGFGAGAALVSLVKGLAARRVGDAESASLLKG
ncbi:MAG TPA: holin [Actinophytocola sp.]|uniref:holin n=1 Tax=Actinophytocola sp. TaxID=1872138 RepID=UPI002DBDA93B|nr:holin [Actinophytocola sp.]HEU5475706.1 holin [Actinophytocola sp.]